MKIQGIKTERVWIDVEETEVWQNFERQILTNAGFFKITTNKHGKNIGPYTDFFIKNNKVCGSIDIGWEILFNEIKVTDKQKEILTMIAELKKVFFSK